MNTMNLNKVFIIGNLTRDPELRQIPSGQAVCSFGVATNRFYTDSMGQKQKQAEFHNVVAWGKQAELVNQYLRKGSSIMVEGRLQTRSWQDPQGTKHWRTEIVAENIQLGPRMDGSGAGPERNMQDAAASPSRFQDGPTRQPQEEIMPTIELPGDNEEIDIKDIPF